MIFKKLLVLDVNGLLVDTYFHKEPRPDESPDARVGNFYVYKRPFCEKFLEFCLDNFTVGVWSSAREHNVNNLVDYVFGHTKEKLAFIWHQADCTDVGLKSPDNQFKPLFLKELSKLWNTVKADLPWTEGDYGPLNTLLVDDTPYKAILNPPNTAIFPRSYTARDQGDSFLGGALRSYLEGLCDASSVQAYVECNPFGEPSITPASPLWSYVSEVVLKAKNALNVVADGIAQIIPGAVEHDKASQEDTPNVWQTRKVEHSSDLSESEVTVRNFGEEEDKHQRWKNRKQNNHSCISLVSVNHAQFSAFDFPSESVELPTSELHSCDNMLEPVESGVGVHGSTSCYLQVSNPGSHGLVHRPLDQGYDNLNQPSNDRLSKDMKRSSLPSGPDEPHEGQLDRCMNQISLRSGPDEPHKGQLDKQTSLPELGNCDGAGEKHYDNLGIPFFEQGQHGAHEPAGLAPFRKHEVLKGLDKEHEQVNQGNGRHGESEWLKKSHLPISDTGLNASEPDYLQREKNKGEVLCGKLEMRDTGFARGSNANYASQHDFVFGNHLSPRHRGFGKQQNKRHISSYDSSNGSFRDDHGQKSERGYHRDHRNLDKRGNHFMDRKQTTDKYWHKSGRGDMNIPSFRYGSHHNKRWGDDPLGASTQFLRDSSVSDPRTWVPSLEDCRQAMTNEVFSSIHVPGSNSSTRPFNEALTLPFDCHVDTAERVMKYNDGGQGQDGGPSSKRHQSFHPRPPVLEISSFWPERSEHLNVNAHKPGDSWWDGKRQCLDYACDEAGASSKLYANTGAYRQHYGGQHGRPQQPCQNVEPSRQHYRIAGATEPYRAQHVASRGPYRHPRDSHRRHHYNGDKYAQEMRPRGFPRTMQRQKGRNF